MRLLAALAWALTAYLVVGLLTGHTPEALRRRRVPARRFQSWLYQAGTGVSPMQFLTVTGGGALLTFLVVWALAGAAPVAFVPAAAVAMIPKSWFARQRAQRQRDRLAAWPDTLRDLLAHLESSMPLHAALVELGHSGPEPLRPTWRRYGVLASALDHRAALEAIRNELADPVSDRVIEVVLVAHEQGSAVVLDLLRDLADSTTDDIRLVDSVDPRRLGRQEQGRAGTPVLIAALPRVAVDERDATLRRRTRSAGEVVGVPREDAVLEHGLSAALPEEVRAGRHGRLHDGAFGHVVPGTPVELASAGFRRSATPLFEEEADAGGRALIAEFPTPPDVHRPRAGTGLAASDDPIDSRQVNSSEWSKERLRRDEAHRSPDLA